MRSEKREMMPSIYLARSGAKHGVWEVLGRHFFITDNCIHGFIRGQRPSKGLYGTMTSLSPDLRSGPLFLIHCNTGTEDHSEVVMATLPEIRHGAHQTNAQSSYPAVSGASRHIYSLRIVSSFPFPSLDTIMSTGSPTSSSIEG
jgi:hypothetical protein